jgi:hypothetical protein
VRASLIRIDTSNCASCGGNAQSSMRSMYLATFWARSAYKGCYSVSRDMLAVQYKYVCCGERTYLKRIVPALVRSARDIDQTAYLVIMAGASLGWAATKLVPDLDLP